MARLPGGGARKSSRGVSAAADSSRLRRASSLRSSSVSRMGGDADEPAARVVRHPLLRPLAGGRQQGLLHGVLGGVEVAVAADEGAEDLRRVAAQQVLDRGAHLPGAASRMGRITTSETGEPSGAGHWWTRLAISVTRSSLAQSSTQ